MKAFFIITRTNEMHKHYESFACLGHEYTTYVYSHPKGVQGWPQGEKLDADVTAAAKAANPDLIVYIGACQSNTPSIQCFKNLKEQVAPTVHFCSDAEDAPWWPELIAYDKAGCFSVQVALDGSSSWPLKDTQLTELTPIDLQKRKNYANVIARYFPNQQDFAKETLMWGRKSGTIMKKLDWVDAK